MNHGYLKQSTASQQVLIGPFVDDTDGKTVETGLTIANTDINLSKNGAATASKNSGGGAHRSNGMYAITFDATDTNTVGELAGVVNMTGALVVVFKFTVLEEAVYDALFGSSAPGYLQPTVAARTLDVTATGAAGVDWGNVENQGTSVDLSATAIDLCDEVTVNSDMRGTDNASLASVCTETRLSELDAATGGKMANQVDIVAVDVAGLDGDAMRGTDNAFLAASAPSNFDNLVISTAGNANSNVKLISDDQGAADNLELDYDGTGYNKSNSTIGTCTTNTDMRGTDSAALASNYTAARAGYIDNLNIGENVAGVSDISGLNDLSEAQVNAQVDLALNTAIPSTPTADSINDYIQRMKYVMVNKMEITEANGNTVIYEDNDTTVYASVNAAYTSDSTTTTRLRLE